jgi:hypothetical protein
MVILSSDRRKIGVNYTQHLRGKMAIHDKMTITLLYKREKRESFGGTAKRFQKTLSLFLFIFIFITPLCCLLGREAKRSGGQVSHSYAPTLKSVISHEIVSYSEHTKKILKVKNLNSNKKIYLF